MMRANPYLMLIGALNFSVTDLDANRQGELSESQRIHLRQHRLKEMEWWLIGLILLVFAGIIISAEWLPVFFVTACIVSMILAIWFRGEEDLHGRVQAVSGKLTFTSSSIWPSYYHVWVGNEHFYAPKRVKHAFEGGRHYRVYFTPGSRTIVSAEVAA